MPIQTECNALPSELWLCGKLPLLSVSPGEVWERWTEPLSSIQHCKYDPPHRFIYSPWTVWIKRHDWILLLYPPRPLPYHHWRSCRPPEVHLRRSCSWCRRAPRGHWGSSPRRGPYREGSPAPNPTELHGQTNPTGDLRRERGVRARDHAFFKVVHLKVINCLFLYGTKIFQHDFSQLWNWMLLSLCCVAALPSLRCMLKKGMHRCMTKKKTLLLMWWWRRWFIPSSNEISYKPFLRFLLQTVLCDMLYPDHVSIVFKNGLISWECYN